jgi:hypothetical protein
MLGAELTLNQYIARLNTALAALDLPLLGKRSLGVCHRQWRISYHCQPHR